MKAISIFYKQVELRNGMPFDVAIPTPKTRRTFDATDAGHDLVVCKDSNDMFKKLGIYSGKFFVYVILFFNASRLA
jgi:DNA-damage-inducible protein J